MQRDDDLRRHSNIDQLMKPYVDDVASQNSYIKAINHLNEDGNLNRLSMHLPHQATELVANANHPDNASDLDRPSYNLPLLDQQDSTSKAGLSPIPNNISFGDLAGAMRLKKFMR